LQLGSVPNLSNIFVLRNVSRLTREAYDTLRLHVPATYTERERVAFGWWGCMLWHRVPASIRAVPSFHIFRNAYLDYLVRNINTDEHVNYNRKFYDFV
jgi:mannosyltransferase OCH1-like enzyme